MPEKIKTITEPEAKTQGFLSLTYACNPVTEQYIIDNIVADLQRGNIPCVLVEHPRGVEIWRKPRCVV